MDISLVVSGNKELTLSVFSPSLLLQEIYMKFKQSIEDKNLTFSIAQQENTDELYIESDEALLHKILCLLIDNACKFTIRGSITLGFGVNEKAVEFFVKDTGIGIDKETQQQIYEPFMQKDVDLDRHFEGSGLGLSVAKGFIELLGGRIWVESVKDAGSTFRFTIPLREEQGKN